MQPVSRMPSATASRFRRPLAAAACLLAVSLAPLSQAAPATPEREVNTFIGTQDDGNTFPGASAPFGLIQVSPIGLHYAGWRYDEEKILGFGHSFVSGAGCWEQGGQVSVLPVTGSIAPGGDFDTGDAKSFDQKRYGARYTHDGEVGQAGYYRVRLTDYGGIDAEATALTRAAAERYTFAADAGSGHVLVNVSQANNRHRVTGSQVRVVGDRAVEGQLTTLSFCGGHQYTTWFRIEFDRPFKAFGVWGQAGGTPGARFSMESEHDPYNGAWLSFDLEDGRSVTAISAISHVDIEGARENLRREGSDGNGRLLGFDAMRKRAQADWARELSSVKVHGGSKDERSVFYTALYHALLQPMTGSDADGRYRGYDNAIHVADGWTYHEYFSLWDTYRSQNQLLALLRPQRARDIGRSLLAIDAQGGWLPRWGYADFDSNVMTGDPVTPFLADLWRYGALQGMEQEAWQALWKNAEGVPPLESRHEGRAGNANYLKDGFVFYDRTFPAKGMDVDPHQGGSATLEYALADCALAPMAAALGHADAAATLRARAGNWRKVWDADLAEADTGFAGFPRPRMQGGEWFTPPTGSYDPRSHYGFHEGTSWQYQWLVPQDLPSLAQAMGGREAMGRRLDAFFAYDELLADPEGAARKAWVAGPYSYYGQYRFNPNNEPTMHVPGLYSLIGQPWKTATVLRAAQTLFTNAPNGVTGNDDLGTMSAWYLFGAMGFSPLMPGSGQMLLHPPRFDRIDIALENGRTLSVRAPGANDGVRYIRSASLDGKPQAATWVDVGRLQQGGTLAYALDATPDTQGWGTHVADAPPALCPAVVQ
ncbi:alpha-mannosidase [Stenotrophomonas daejeonensis]|uniref:Alpha-mannosidase n=2 Tax=Stenotrophomonas daejeonensis TaxID=659018 RepID=A0A0R0DQ90_9GAMM|nr:alpha-mannosidase [Stenotrophomonas daejeonensis]